MSLLHRYADFGTQGVGDQASVMRNADSLEDERLEAFENGYQAGWDDSTKVHKEDGERVLADVAQNLQDMSFTYHEAYGKIALAMKPLLTQFVTKLMPAAIQRGLHAHILQEVATLLDAQADGAIELAVAPACLGPINDVLSDQLSVPFNIVSEPALTEGQAYVRVGASEREINLDAVLTATADAVAAFFDQAQKDTDDG
tara:strand:- start:29 stop:628 length:600 start_codon:yes stop_codon:yes gene_type:complete